MAEEISANTEEMIIGLYDMGEIGYVDPPGPEVEVADPSYPVEAFKKLKSGRMSPHYVGLRNFTSFSDSLPIPIAQQQRTRDLVVGAFCEMLDEQEYDHLLGIPQAMTCLSGLIAQTRGDSVIWMRVGEKSYGVHEKIQGNYAESEKVATTDNVITDGGTKLELVEPLTEAGLEIASFNVFCDREEGGQETVEAAGYNFASVIGMSKINEILFNAKRITHDQYRWAVQYGALLGE